MASIWNDPAFQNHTENDLIRESKVKPEPIVQRSIAKPRTKPVLNDVIKQAIQISSKERGQNNPKVIKNLLDNLPKNVGTEKQNNLAKNMVKDLADIIKKTNNTRKSTEAGKDLANNINQSRADRNTKVKEAIQPKDNTRFKYNESAQKAADNGMNKRDRPNIRNVTFGSNDDESRSRVRASLARNGKELNRPEYNGSPRPSSSIKTGNLINTGRVMLGNSMMGNLGAANVFTPLDAHNKNLVVLSGNKGELDTVGNRVPITKDGKTYLNPDTGQFEPTNVIYDEETGMPMYFDNTRNRYIPLDPAMPIPEVPSQIPSYVPRDESMGDAGKKITYTEPTFITNAPTEPSFDKRAYPASDNTIKRINGAKDLASLGTVYNPNTDTSVNNSVPELYGSNNQSAIPVNQTSIPNMSSPNSKVTIGSMANNTPTVISKNTPNKLTTVASQVSTPVTTRVNPQNASMTQSVPVEEVTLGSIINNVNKAPLVRRNGGFDEYRRQSALAALRNAGGISPAEGVQRGIIPYEALQYI